MSVTHEIITGDALASLKRLPSNSVQCCVTSPPYWNLRDYGVDGQIGREETPEQYVRNLVKVFRQVRRVLADDGILWLNLGDTYSTSGAQGLNPNRGNRGTRGMIGRTAPKGLKPKDLVGIPWRVAFALQRDGWYLRCDVVWSKPNPMPESVRDRPTRAHEYIFLLSKSERYFYDADAIAEPSSWDPSKSKMPDGLDTGEGGHGNFHRNGREKGKRTDKQRGHSRRHAGFNERWDQMEKEEQCSGTRNKRTVWEIATRPYAGAHFATYPEDIPRTCILSGSKPGDTVLDPFAGSGTTGAVALALGRNAQLIEINPEYVTLINKRLSGVTPAMVFDFKESQ